MLETSLSLDKKGTLEQTERHEKKEQKRVDRELEMIFDEFVSEKIARQKSNESKQAQARQISQLSRFEHKDDLAAAKVLGQFQEEAKTAKDRHDTAVDNGVTQSGISGLQQASVGTHESDESVPDQGEAVEKLKAVIAEMTSRQLSEGEMLVTIEGEHGVKVSVAMVKSGQHTDIFISSDSQKALEIIANQANAIENQLEMGSQQQISLSIVS